jgi:hypothetical protein
VLNSTVRPRTGAEDKHVIALAAVLQCAVSVTRQPAARDELDRAVWAREHSSVAAGRLSVRASLRGAEDGREHADALKRALGKIRSPSGVTLAGSGRPDRCARSVRGHDKEDVFD